MLSMDRVRDDYGDFICRRCLNRKYGASLQPENCRYGYKHICPCCKKMQNIVVGLNSAGHLKMLFRHAV